jgi:tetratricopeptide (TPR) repeat protein
MGYFFNSQNHDAVDVLGRVVNRRTVEPELFDLTLVYLGASYYSMGEEQKASALWERVSEKSLLAYSTLGYMYSSLGVDRSAGEEITKRALQSVNARMSDFVNSLKMNHAYSLLVLGKFDEAYSYISDIDLNQPIYTYQPDQETVLRFYDLALIDSYSKVVFGESIKNLEPIVTASSGELASFASYYVAQMYLYLEEYESATKFTLKAKKLAVQSSLTMIRAMACEASIHLLEKGEKRGLKLLEDEITRIHGKPSSLLEMIRVWSSRTYMKPSGIEQGETRRFLGSYRSILVGTCGRSTTSSAHGTRETRIR